MNFAQMKQKLQEKSQKKDYSDVRFWKLKTDEEKRGSAVIRFLPDKKTETPFVEYYSHFIKYPVNGETKYYINKCSTSVNEPCEICTKNKELYNSAFPEDKAEYANRKRKQHFISNIYIEKDPANPANEGKVFLWEYGYQIHLKLEEAMFGATEKDKDGIEDDAKIFFPWCLTDEKDENGNNLCGAPFVLRSIKKKGTNFPTYESSKFKEPSEFMNGDEAKIEEILSQTHSLEEWTDKKSYPTPTEVIAKAGVFLGIKQPKSEDVVIPKQKSRAETLEEDENPPPDDEDRPKSSSSEDSMSDEDYINSLNL